MTNPAATPMTALFVYGTLRQGFGLHPRIARALVDGTQIIRAKALGHRLYDGPGYPYMVPEKGYQTIGDLMIVRSDSSDFRSITEMEVGCGYEFRRIEVEFDGFDGPALDHAFAYVYPSAVGWGVGAPVPEGDWAEHRRMSGRSIVR